MADGSGDRAQFKAMTEGTSLNPAPGGREGGTGTRIWPTTKAAMAPMPPAGSRSAIASSAPGGTAS